MLADCPLLHVSALDNLHKLAGVLPPSSAIRRAAIPYTYM